MLVDLAGSLVDRLGAVVIDRLAGERGDLLGEAAAVEPDEGPSRSRVVEPTPRRRARPRCGPGRCRRACRRGRRSRLAVVAARGCRWSRGPPFMMTRQSPAGSSPRPSAARQARVPIGNCAPRSGTCWMTARLWRVSAMSRIARVVPRSRCFARSRRSVAWTSFRRVSASIVASNAGPPRPRRRCGGPRGWGLEPRFASGSTGGAGRRTDQAARDGLCHEQAALLDGCSSSGRSQGPPRSWRAIPGRPGSICSFDAKHFRMRRPRQRAHLSSAHAGGHSSSAQFVSSPVELATRPIGRSVTRRNSRVAMSRWWRRWLTAGIPGSCLAFGT